jgi:hypothetical protein
MSLTSLKSKVENFHILNRLSTWKRIDAICVMNKGIVCNVDANERIMRLPKRDTHLKEFKTENSLTIFYGLLTNLFGASMPILNALEYIKKI